jgi:hypothetical protein
VSRVLFKRTELFTEPINAFLFDHPALCDKEKYQGMRGDCLAILAQGNSILKTNSGLLWIYYNWL